MMINLILEENTRSYNTSTKCKIYCAPWKVISYPNCQSRNSGYTALSNT